MKCFYHSADLDGYCSGALVKLKHPDCEMIGINYGNEFPWDRVASDEKVFMVDFSLQPFDQMVRLNALAELVWIDHHKTAIEEWKAVGRPHIKGFREVGKAGCEITWEYLYPDRDMPRAVRLLGRYDVWDHSDPDTLRFQMGMRLWTWDPRVVNIKRWEDIIFETDHPAFRNALYNGDVVLKYQALQNEMYAQTCAFDTEMDGLRCIAANAQMVNSKLFDTVWDESRHDAMLTFGWRNGRWTVSLYTSKEGVDVGVVAKARGGGGHAGAAGFQCDELPFRLN